MLPGTVEWEERQAEPQGEWRHAMAVEIVDMAAGELEHRCISVFRGIQAELEG